MPSKGIEVEISAGEFVDKLTILRIKKQRISDPEKAANVLREHDLLQHRFDESIVRTSELDALVVRLDEVNQAPWDIEDAIREKERAKTFDDEFTSIARSVYVQNDRRAAIKREINVLLDSSVVEEKSYADYGSDG
jgi:hypothetical protein